MATMLTDLYRSVSKVPALKRMAPARIRKSLYALLLEIEIPTYPDRVYMRETIFPLIAERRPQCVLAVGARRYSRDIVSMLTKQGIEVWTIDIDPAAARWGSPGRHVVGDAVCLDNYFPPQDFDCLIVNGVYGWGIDTEEQIDRAVKAGYEVLKPGSLLILGWNPSRIGDLEQFFSTFFRPIEGLDRVPIAGADHAYACLERA